MALNSISVNNNHLSTTMAPSAGSFVGKGSTFVYNKEFNILPFKKYCIVFEEPHWKYTSGNNGFLFSVTFFKDGNQHDEIIYSTQPGREGTLLPTGLQFQTQDTSIIPKYIVFYSFENDYYRIGGRADDGVVVKYNIYQLENKFSNTSYLDFNLNNNTVSTTSRNLVYDCDHFIVFYDTTFELDFDVHATDGSIMPPGNRYLYADFKNHKIYSQDRRIADIVQIDPNAKDELIGYLQVSGDWNAEKETYDYYIVPDSIFLYDMKYKINGMWPEEYRASLNTYRRYIGEPISIGHNYNIKNYCTIPNLDGNQSGTSYDNWFVFYCNWNNRFVLVDANTNSIVYENNIYWKNYSTPHGNMMSLGKTKRSNESIMPPIYISQWDENLEYGCYVVDLKYVNGNYVAEFFQIILFANIPKSILGLGSCDMIVDADNDLIYTITYKTGNYYDEPGYENIILKFDLPDISSGTLNNGILEVNMYQNDILDNFEIEPTPIRQDACINNGNIIISAGLTGEYVNTMKIIQVDPIRKKVISRINLHDNGDEYEPESLFIYDKKLLMTRGSSELYEVVLY